MAIGTLVVPIESALSASGKPSKNVPNATPSAIAAKIQTVR